MRKFALCIVVLLSLIMTGCSNTDQRKSSDRTDTKQEEDASMDDSILSEDEQKAVDSQEKADGVTEAEKTNKKMEYQYNQELNIINDNYRTYYEVFLYSFCDSNGDGIGDINGLISKLDYINDGDPNSEKDLGFNGIWLMPIMPSDTYHKYDVTDYYEIDSQYGTLEDFQRLLQECDKRGIKVIIDLVLNHTSSNHPWFLSAVKSLAIEPCGQDVCVHEELCREHNPYVNYYNFVQGKPDGTTYYETGVKDWYYEGVFTSNMPDLNLADKNLRKDIEDIMNYWLDMGVGGFRLDAALHYYSDNTEKNTEVLSWLNQFIKNKNKNNYMVAEVWTNFSTFSKYYASGIDSIFNFAFAAESGRIAEIINLNGYDNSAKAFGEGMLQVQKVIRKYNPEGIDAPFYTNHDTARSAGFYSDNAEKTKMAGGMNLMMNGNVFVYYGEELGMSGSGRDENKRAPMYWSANDTPDMTIGPGNMDRISHYFGSYEEQVSDPLSIYNYYKRAIRLRNENPEIARGEISLITDIADMDICALTKTFQNNKIIMIFNISEEKKELTLSKETHGYEGIRGYLSANGEEVLLNGETISLPPYSIVILK